MKGLSKQLEKITPSITLAVTSKAREMKQSGIDVLSFSAGEPDFDTPKPIQDAACEALKLGYTRYTAVPGIIELRKEICKKLKNDNGLEYTPDEIIVNSGAKHSLYTALQALLNPSEEVLIPVPFWVSYTEMVKLAGGKPVLVQTKKENGFKVTAKELRENITDKTKVLMLNNPVNPSGSVYTKEELQEIAKIIEENEIYVLSDEIYEKLIYDGIEFVAFASLSKKAKELTITINGMSKAYAMTGWRIGYCAANKDIIKAMSIIQGHCVSHPCSIAQYASIAALQCDPQIIEEMKKAYKQRRNYMVNTLSKIEELEVIKPDGAFYVYVDISKLIGKEISGNEITGSLDFSKALLEQKHVAVIPGIGFGTDEFIRLSYATSLDTIKEGLVRIKDFIQGK